MVYVIDDGNLVGLAKVEGSGQTLIGVLFNKLGTPLEVAKQSALAPQCVSWDSACCEKFHTHGAI